MTLPKLFDNAAFAKRIKKEQHVKPLLQHEIPVRPWQIVATDLFHFHNQNYILTVDYYSKYPSVCRLREFSSKEVVNVTKQIFGE